MAYSLVTNIRKYIGSSYDTKPQSSSTETIPEGSTFLETDTGDLYRFHEDEWTGIESSEEVEASATNEMLALVLFELRAIRERLELATG